MRSRPLHLALLFAVLSSLSTIAPSAAAISIRVDFTASVALNFIGSPRGTVDLAGSLGTFDVPGFPSVVPVNAPFSLVAEGFGPEGGETTYLYPSAGGLAFAFTTASSGHLVATASPGRVSAGYSQCYPTHCAALQTWTIEIDPRYVWLSRGHHVGSDSGVGPLDFAFTVVPEISTASLVGIGTLLLQARRKR
jgi:hypothetical protein